MFPWNTVRVLGFNAADWSILILGLAFSGLMIMLL
jgi:hypothetical protein